MAITAMKVALRQLQAQKALTSAPDSQNMDPFARTLEQVESRVGNTLGAQQQTASWNPGDYMRQLSNQLGTGIADLQKEGGLLSKQHADMIKNLARLQIMSLNQSLINAFSGNSGSEGLGIGNSFMSAMAGLLQTVQSPPPQPPATIPAAYQTRPVVQPEDTDKTPEAPVAQTPETPPEAPRVLTEKSQKDDVTSESPAAVEPDKQAKAAEAQVKTEPKVSADNRDVNEIIKDTAAKYGLDPNLVKAVVKTESNFNPKAVSSVGAMGLMQLMPKTAAGLGVDDAFDPEQNINGGAKYLKQMLDRYHGKIDHALAAYNWGPGNFDRSRGNSMPRETRNYIRIVNKHLKNYSASDQA